MYFLYFWDDNTRTAATSDTRVYISIQSGATFRLQAMRAQVGMTTATTCAPEWGDLQAMRVALVAMVAVVVAAAEALILE